MRKRNPEERFWEKVDAEGDCWEWTGSTHKGYGFFWNGERQVSAHRWVWEHLVALLPPRAQIDHLCRNRACVNPDHLDVVTNKENVLRGEGVTARNARKTHCKHGHPFTEENTYIRLTGGRRCIECLNLAGREYRKKLREGAS